MFYKKYENSNFFRDRIIVTQAPKKQTVIDFYRLINEWQFQVVVMLNEIDETQVK